MISTKQRTPLIVFVLASVIGLMAVTAIAAMSMQKAYSQNESYYEKTYGSERYCFKENGALKCFSSIEKDGKIVSGAFYICGQEASHASLSPQNQVQSGCEKESFFK